MSVRICDVAVVVVVFIGYFLFAAAVAVYMFYFFLHRPGTSNRKRFISQEENTRSQPVVVKESLLQVVEHRRQR